MNKIYVESWSNFFVIYIKDINDLLDGLSSSPKSFADDTSLFSVVREKNLTAKHLSGNLQKISNWGLSIESELQP